MTNSREGNDHSTRRARPAVYAGILAVAFAAMLPHPARAHHGPPSVPEAIQVPAGNEAFLEGHAVGTQNYICLPSGKSFAWTFFGPQATLMDDDDQQIITHFLSANPYEGGTLRATWQHSRDTSAVWAQTIASVDVKSVRPSIPWLLLRVVGAQDGPTGGGRLTASTYVHRLNTSGGVAPTTGCAAARDVGTKSFVPYTADYFFYKDAGGDEAWEN